MESRYRHSTLEHTGVFVVVIKLNARLGKTDCGLYSKLSVVSRKTYVVQLERMSGARRRRERFASVLLVVASKASTLGLCAGGRVCGCVLDGWLVVLRFTAVCFPQAITDNEGDDDLVGMTIHDNTQLHVKG